MFIHLDLERVSLLERDYFIGVFIVKLAKLYGK